MRYGGRSYRDKGTKYKGIGGLGGGWCRVGAMPSARRGTGFRPSYFIKVNATRVSVATTATYCLPSLP